MVSKNKKFIKRSNSAIVTIFLVDGLSLLIIGVLLFLDLYLDINPNLIAVPISIDSLLTLFTLFSDLLMNRYSKALLKKYNLSDEDYRELNPTRRIEIINLIVVTIAFIVIIVFQSIFNLFCLSIGLIGVALIYICVFIVPNMISRVRDGDALVRDTINHFSLYCLNNHEGISLKDPYLEANEFNNESATYINKFMDGVLMHHDISDIINKIYKRVDIKGDDKVSQKNIVSYVSIRLLESVNRLSDDVENKAESLDVYKRLIDNTNLLFEYRNLFEAAKHYNDNYLLNIIADIFCAIGVSISTSFKNPADELNILLSATFEDIILNCCNDKEFSNNTDPYFLVLNLILLNTLDKQDEWFIVVLNSIFSKGTCDYDGEHGYKTYPLFVVINLLIIIYFDSDKYDKSYISFLSNSVKESFSVSAVESIKHVDASHSFDEIYHIFIDTFSILGASLYIRDAHYTSKFSSLFYSSENDSFMFAILINILSNDLHMYDLIYENTSDFTNYIITNGFKYYKKHPEELIPYISILKEYKVFMNNIGGETDADNFLSTEVINYVTNSKQRRTNLNKKLQEFKIEELIEKLNSGFLKNPYYRDKETLLDKGCPLYTSEGSSIICSNKNILDTSDICSLPTIEEYVSFIFDDFRQYVSDYNKISISEYTDDIINQIIDFEPSYMRAKGLEMSKPELFTKLTNALPTLYNGFRFFIKKDDELVDSYCKEDAIEFYLKIIPGSEKLYPSTMNDVLDVANELIDKDADKYLKSNLLDNLCKSTLVLTMKVEYAISINFDKIKLYYLDSKVIDDSLDDN